MEGQQITMSIRERPAKYLDLSFLNFLKQIIRDKNDGLIVAWSVVGVLGHVRWTVSNL